MSHDWISNYSRKRRNNRWLKDINRCRSWKKQLLLHLLSSLDAETDGSFTNELLRLPGPHCLRPFSLDSVFSVSSPLHRWNASTHQYNTKPIRILICFTNKTITHNNFEALVVDCTLWTFYSNILHFVKDFSVFRAT